MQLSEDQLRVFASRQGLEFETKCDRCSTFVTHKAIKAEKTADFVRLYYEPCPGMEHGACTNKPISAKEKAHWGDMYWGMRSALEGHDPSFKEPMVSKLDEQMILHLGDDEPFAVVYLGTCSFVSLLAVANEGWDKTEPPFTEECVRYEFMLEGEDGSWQAHVDPTTPGARLTTIAYWEPIQRRQRV